MLYRVEKIRQKAYGLLQFLIILIFAGSVFITSGKFVNSENAPKVYFVILSSIIAFVILVITAKSKITTDHATKIRILKGIFLVSLIQALYGICQYANIFSSNHSAFSVTGSFDNPAGFAAVVALLFPVGLYFALSKTQPGRYFYASALMIVVLSIVLSRSRTGILAILVSTAMFFILYARQKGKTTRNNKLLGLWTVLCFIPATILLYQLNKDSADGRILIWNISWEMIKDKPIFGHGHGSFKAKYMDYQAEHFADNKNPQLKNLADNVKHPFNEFIMIAVQYGIVGFLFINFMLTCIIRSVFKANTCLSPLIFSSFAACLVFAMLSYPLQYMAIWILLLILCLIALIPVEIRMKKTRHGLILRSVIIISAIICFSYTLKHIQYQLKWKAIAQQSLSGQTIIMLPQYRQLYPALKSNPFFLYNFGAELNIAGKYSESLAILKECKKKFNDYDLQLLLADNYYRIGAWDKALNTYRYASWMIPCRFWPMYQMFSIYRETGQNKKALRMAKRIYRKKVKVPSLTIKSIKKEAKSYLALH